MYVSYILVLLSTKWDIWFVYTILPSDPEKCPGVYSKRGRGQQQLTITKEGF